jgi:hypothetical protein
MGKLIEEKRKWYFKDGKERYTYLWDEETGLIQQGFVYKNSVLAQEIKYFYDHLKRLVRKEQWSSPDTVLKMWEIYEYDKDNRIVKEEKLSSNSEGDMCITYEYDKKGRKVKWIWIMKFPTDSTYDENISTYKYDNKGRLVEESFEGKRNFPL